MKNLKNFILITVVASLIVLSCQTESDFNEKPLLTESLKTFQKEFSKEFNLIDWNSKTNYNLSDSNKDIPNIDFTMIKINESDSYYVEFEEKGFYVNVSNSNKKIDIYKVNDSNKFVTIPYKKNELLPDLNSNSIFLYVNDNLHAKSWWRYTLCVTACTGVALAIAGTDGPAPFMDILAVAYQIQCGLECSDKYMSDDEDE